MIFSFFEKIFFCIIIFHRNIFFSKEEKGGVFMNGNLLATALAVAVTLAFVSATGF